MDQVKQKSYDLYTALDSLGKIIPIMGNDYKIQVGPSQVRLPIDQIQVMQSNYAQIQTQIKTLANSLPTFQELGS